MSLNLSGFRQATFKVLASIASIIAINFLVFMLAALYLGGDALGGKEEHGKYFLESHGHFTEVSEKVFRYSKVHARSVEVTAPLLFFLVLALVRGPTRKSVLSSHGNKHNLGGGA